MSNFIWLSRNYVILIFIISILISAREFSESGRYWYRSVGNKLMHCTNGNIVRNTGDTNIKLAHVNVRGGLKDKEAEIDLVLDDYNIDLLGVSETNQKREDVIHVQDKNYYFEPAFNYSSAKTRLGVYIKKNINYKVNRDLMSKTEIPCVWLDLKIKGQNIAVVNIYREFRKYLPREEREEAELSASVAKQFERFQEFVELWVEQLAIYDEVWCLGDFNLDINKIRSNPNSIYRDFVKLLDDRIFSLGVNQIINGVTWVKDNGLQRSCVDHIYTNSSVYHSVLINRCVPSTDHSMVSVVKICQGKFQRTQYKTSRCFNNFNEDEYNYILEGMYLEDLLTIKDPEVQVQRLTAAMTVAADTVCPLKTSRIRAFHTKWMTDEIRYKLRERDLYYAKYMYVSSLPFPNEDVVKESYNKYKQIRNWLTRNIREAKKIYKRDYVNNNRVSDSSKCWRMMNEIVGRNANYSPPITLVENNKVIDCPQIISEKLVDFFDDKVRKINESLPGDLMHHPPDWPDGREKFSFQKVETAEVIDHIKSLSNSSAFGIDTLSNRLVKISNHNIAHILADITNNCFETGKFPEFWKKGKINALHKKGSKTDVNNYRPITLLCSLSKIVEKVVYKQIYNYLTSSGFMDPRQYGFRENFNTTLAVLDYVQEVLLAKNDPVRKKKVNTLLLDLSAAFDVVSHSKLLIKFQSFGFSDNAINFIKSYLEGREVFVEVETKRSKTVKIRSGVPQGSCLGPLLYSAFIADIKDINDYAKIIYADDTNCVVVADNNVELAVRTEQAMDDLVKYYNAIQLKLNPIKTEIINHDSRNSEITVVVDRRTNETKTSVNSARMLGVMVDPELNFKSHIDMLVKDVKIRIKQFHSLVRIAGRKARRMMGFAFLLSKFSYAVSCYAGASATDLGRVKTVYNDCLRSILGVTRGQQVPMETVRRRLKVLSFEGLVKYFDMTIMAGILRNKTPANLYKFIVTEHQRGTRARDNELVSLNFIPKNERINRSFLVRGLKSYNSLPLSTRKISCPKMFSKSVKQHLYEKENSEATSCVVS